MPSPTSASADVPAPAVPRWLHGTRRFKAYLALTKPRIIELLLVTTVPTMVLAERGWPSWWLLLATLIGGVLSAGSANTFNSYIDRDIDAVMKRTRTRPLVTGEVTPRAAHTLAWALAVASTVWFYWVVGSPLAALLSVIAIFGYVVIYTLILKRRTSQNIVWGGAAGCMPVLIGWAAVTESISWTPVLLFLIIFFWQPPHYWPLAMRFKQDYANAEIPMLPVVASTRRVATEMIVYAVLMLITSMILVPVAGLTWVYTVVAFVAGSWFVWGCVRLLMRSLRGEPKLREMRLFRDSIMYLTIVFAAVLLDPFLPETFAVWPV